MEQIKRMKVRELIENEPVNHQPSQTDVPDRQLSKFFKALSDHTRREILKLLERHPRSVGEIVDNFQLSQPTISRHLSVLREADLVVDQRRGQHVIYRLNAGTLTESILSFFHEFRHSRQELERVGIQRVSSVSESRPRRPRRPSL
jgi:DNA-binding transcriptional ArsR family regulator